MTQVPPDDVVVTRAPRVVPAVTVTVSGLTVALSSSDGLSSLLVGSTGPGQALSLVLPSGPGAVAGLSVFTRLGHLHARHWALVWAAGPAPASGVDFSSGDLRFRREAHVRAVAVGPAWLAVAVGAFREATVCLDDSEPLWLALDESS